MTTYVSERERRELVAAEVTLNGERAIISGVQQLFATVRAFDKPYVAQYTWHVARNIVREHAGEFRA